VKIFKALFLFLLFFSPLFAKEGKLSTSQLEALLRKNIVIIDIRREDEWKKTGIIPNSYRLTFYNKKNEYNMKRWLYIFARLVKSKNNTFVLVSSNSKRAKKVAQILIEEKNYKNAHYLDKGINKWIREDKKLRFFK